MEVKTAITIISALADGVDPFTGELLTGSPYQQADTVRSLFLALKGLEEMKLKVNRVRDLPDNAGIAWTTEEEEKLITKFEGGLTIKELATEHGRTEGAIKSRLIKLGKIDE